MSLLDRANFTVTVFPDYETVDADGNPFRKPSDTGVEKRVMIQPRPQSGTSARRSEEDTEGFETEDIYRMRFRRGDEMDLGIRSYIVWEGKRWGIDGHPNKYNGSKRTKHQDYTIVRT